MQLAGLTSARLRAPAAFLAVLLQRMPVDRIVAAADELAASPGVFLARASTCLAVLGAVDSMAGATVYTLSTGTPGHPSPYMVQEGSQIEGVAFALVANPPTASPPQSWTLTGSMPPGLIFGASGDAITGPGVVNVSNPTLTGTPTASGDYTMVLTAWEDTGGTGLSSSTFNYEVDVQSSVSPPPPPTTPTTPDSGGGAPGFATQPLSVSLVPGQGVALDAAATGAPTYQWRLNGAPISGATDPTLYLADGSAAAGSYTCVATNSAGSATSDAAAVSVGAVPTPGRLVDISARANVMTGGNLIFGGFAIGGGSLPVLVRASGPAIAAAPFNVPGTLPDPLLQLFNATTNVQMESNAAWAGNPTIAAEAAQVGAFAWTDPASHDAALFVPSLAAGPYTAQMSGESGDTGVGLVEIYDALPSVEWGPGSPHLVNLSARVDAGLGADVPFIGFVITGQSAVTLLIRASGPAIAASPFDVPGTLPDPQLTLQNTSTGAVIASNSGWGGEPEISSVSAAVGAFSWSNPASHDSALLITLPSGNYTAAASGASADTGVVLVEVYVVP